MGTQFLLSLPRPFPALALNILKSYLNLAPSPCPIVHTRHGHLLALAGVALAVYGLIGIFGAARFGLATQGDLLKNSWLGGHAEGVLDAVLVAYLAISIPPIQV